MKDCKITKSVINERQELQVTMLVKSKDYTKAEYLLLCKGKTDGDTYDMEITGLTPGDNIQAIKDKRKELAFQMGLYEERLQLGRGEAKKALYLKYKIKSRTELSDSQLDEEIETHKNEGLQITQ